MVINIELVRDITCTPMHCYAPNFEEVEGENWFGPVRLSIHLPLPRPPSTRPTPPPPQKKKKKKKIKIWIPCEKKSKVEGQGHI